MTKQEVFQRIIEAMYSALRANEEFQAACELLPAAGLLDRVDIFLRLYEQHADQPAADSAIKIDDAEFLRLLRIDPDMEIK